MSHYTQHIFFCTNQKPAGKKCCQLGDAMAMKDYAKQRLVEWKLEGAGKVRVSHSGCLGRCALGPALVIYPEGVWYTYHGVEDIDEILEEHVLKGKIVERLLID